MPRPAESASNVWHTLFAPSPHRPLLTDPEEIRRAFLHWRVRLLGAMFLGYAILYFCRKNISGALPVMAKDLGYSNTELGLLGSTLYVTYGLGKFANGILADRSNIRSFLAASLVASGALNLWFSSATSLWTLAFVWGLNGWFQSMGFPPIARGLTIWYEARGKALRWAVWTTSHQAGTAAVMVLTAAILARSGGDWRLVFRIPAILCILGGVAMYALLPDTPESQGLPRPVSMIVDADEDTESYRSVFFRRVLGNRQLWVVALVNLCVYVIRYGTLDWAAKYLADAKGYAPAEAAGMAATIPFFGIGGVLVAGYAADRLFSGRFRVVNGLMLAALGLAIVAWLLLPGDHTTDFVFLGVIGFLVEGPQSLLGGIASVEVGGSPKVASAAAGFVGVCGYVGATLSSVGTGFFIDAFGWTGAFVFWIACAAVGFLLCTFAWKEPRPAPASA